MIVPDNGPGVHARAPDLELTGPIPATFKISSFPEPATTKTTPTLHKVTLDELVTLLTTHERRRNKDGRGWSGATYKPGTTRANANVVEWSVAAGDFDHFSFDEYVEFRDHITGLGLAAIYYSTYGSSDDDFRFRVAIPLTKPVPEGRYADVWHRVNGHLFGGRNDANTKAGSQMLYLPAAPEGVAVVAEYVPGLALDWEKLPEAPLQLEPASGGSTFGQDVGIGRQTMEFLLFGAAIGHQRAAALSATRSLLAAGKSVEETAEKVWQGLQASPIGDENDPWTREHALYFAEDMARREPTPLKELPKLKLNGHINGTSGEKVSATLKSVVAAERNGTGAATTPTPARSGDASATADPAAEKVSARTTSLTAAETKTLFRTAREVGASTPAATDWIVPGYVARSAVTELDGKLKASGKTTLLMAMVAKVVDGEPFMGRPTKQTGVVILTEQNAASLRQALARANLLDREDVVILAWYDVRALPWPVVVQLASEEAKRLGYHALIVDTLSQFAGITGDGENSSGAALEAMKPLQEAAAEDLAVIVSRHERKSGGEVGESARGSSAFSGAVDIVLSLRRPEGQTRETVRVLQALSRFDETPAELVIDFADGEYVALGSTEDVKRQEARGAVLDYLPTEEADAIDMKALLESLADLKIKRTILQGAIEEHLTSGVVSRTGNGKRGDPYRYWKSQGNNSVATTYPAAERNEAPLTPDDTIGCANCGVMPVEAEGDECEQCAEADR